MKAHLNVLERMLLAVTDCLADESPLPVGQQRPLCARWPLLPDWNEWRQLCNSDLPPFGEILELVADAEDMPLRKAESPLSRASSEPAADAKDPPEGLRTPSIGPPRREMRIAPGGCCCRKRRGTRVRGSRKIVAEDGGRHSYTCFTCLQLLTLAWITPPLPPPPPGSLSKCKQV